MSCFFLDAATQSCPGGSAACVIHGSSGSSAGDPGQRLKITEDGLVLLQYTSSVTQGGITPTTQITFKCPPRGEVTLS